MSTSTSRGDFKPNTEGVEVTVDAAIETVVEFVELVSEIEDDDDIDFSGIAITGAARGSGRRKPRIQEVVDMTALWDVLKVEDVIITTGEQLNELKFKPLIFVRPIRQYVEAHARQGSGRINWCDDVKRFVSLQFTAKRSSENGNLYEFLATEYEAESMSAVKTYRVSMSLNNVQKWTRHMGRFSTEFARQNNRVVAFGMSTDEVREARKTAPYDTEYLTA